MILDAHGTEIPKKRKRRKQPAPTHQFGVMRIPKRTRGTCGSTIHNFDYADTPPEQRNTRGYC